MSKRLGFFFLLVVVLIQLSVLLLYFSRSFYRGYQVMSYGFSVKKNVKLNVWRTAARVSEEQIGTTFMYILPPAVSGKVTTSRHSRISMSRSRKPHIPVGYVLATHYIDQMSGSTTNLFSLQCWASTLPGTVKVVEPFLHYGSMLGFELDPMVDRSHGVDSENTIKLFDMYDKTEWGKETARHNFSGLVSWKHFLHHAPKQLILVDKVCSNSTLCMVCKETDFFESPHFVSSAKKFAQYYNFYIVRRVCYEHKMYKEKEFQQLVYGKFHPNEVVVLFNHFGGIEEGNILRILVDIQNCQRPDLFESFFPPNKDILQQSHRYVEKYMSNISSAGYISVMFRTEQLARGNKFYEMTKESQMSLMLYCIEDMVYEVNKLMNTTGAKSIFLSTDAGKYGSAYFRKMDSSHYFHEGVLKPGWDEKKLRENARHYFFHDGVLENGLEELQKSLFGEVIQLSDRIDSVVEFQSPGYVALLEMILAANGTCLVQAGGGMFHMKVADLHYMQSETSCVHSVYC